MTTHRLEKTGQGIFFKTKLPPIVELQEPIGGKGMGKDKAYVWQVQLSAKFYKEDTWQSMEAKLSAF